MVGDWTNEAHDFSPFEGGADFSPGRAAYAELFQDVDVETMYVIPIDNKKQTFRFTAQVRSDRQKNPDASQIVIWFLDKTKKKTLDSFAFPTVRSVAGWRALSTVLLPPPQTRYIRITLKSHGAVGTANEAVFDSLSLKAIVSVATAVGKSARPNANRPSMRTTHSIVLDGTWRIDGDELVQTESDGNATMLLGTGPLSNYDLRFKVKFYDGQSGAWLRCVFHYIPPLYQNTGGDRYEFEIYNRTHAKMVSYPNEVWTREGGAFETSPLLLGQLLLGQWYEVEVQVRGKEYWVLVEKREVIHKFARYESGWAGLGSLNCVTRYKDISITAPNGRVLWKGLPDDLPGK